MRKVLVAPDKFKGTMRAADVASTICAGILDVTRDWSCVAMPLADGGDGTIDALCHSGWTPHFVSATDAHGQPVVATIARRGRSVAVELADVCGIARARGPLRPWQAHTAGLGQLLRDLVSQGVKQVVVGLGGSASLDGGSGILRGLGFEIVDQKGGPVPLGLEGLRSAHRIVPPRDLAHFTHVTWTVLVDVTAPLSGPRGAAMAFGRQKGLTQAEIAVADGLLRRWGEVLTHASGYDAASHEGSGAAGGVGAALASMLGADLVSGAEYIARAIGLWDQVATASALVTGEGRLDDSTFMGKGPGLILRSAARSGVPAYFVAGDVDPEAGARIDCGLISLTELAGSVESAMAHPQMHLSRAGRRIGQDLAGVAR